MSVYVDRLPDCCDCCVCNDDYWKCGINRESISHDGRREDCPLIEIVRCKDCEFCIVEEPISRGIIPDVYCRIWESNVSTDDYCSYGERKLKNPDDSLLTEDVEACKEQESKLESDLISRQAAIEALTGWQTDPTDEEIVRTLKELPPVEPPTKVVAQIKVDIDEIVERIKEEYEIKDRPVCEDAISRQAVIDIIEGYPHGDWNIETMDDMVNMVRQLLSAKVEPERPKVECGYCPTKRDGVLTIVSKGGDEDV